MDLKNDMVRVNVHESNGGGSETARYDTFELNCNLGNHRPQRMYYKRDGTPFECLNAGVSSGLKNRTAPRIQQSHDAHRTPRQTKELKRREKQGDRVAYPLPADRFEAVTAVQGTESKNWETMFPIGRENGNVHISDFQTFEANNRENTCFLGPWRSYVNLHDQFPLETVRSVFTIFELLRMHDVMQKNGRLFFLMPAITEHLAVRNNEFELCEVDFQRHVIVFYSQSSLEDARRTLPFYADCIWNQFVFPAQDQDWNVQLFAMDDASSLANFVFIIEARIQDFAFGQGDLLLLDDKEKRAKNVVRSF